MATIEIGELIKETAYDIANIMEENGLLDLDCNEEDMEKLPEIKAKITRVGSLLGDGGLELLRKTLMNEYNADIGIYLD